MLFITPVVHLRNSLTCYPRRRLQLAEEEAGPVLHEHSQGQGMATSSCTGEQSIVFTWGLLYQMWNVNSDKNNYGT